MNYNKIREVCRIVRIVMGLLLIIAAIYTEHKWLYIGFLPLVAGLANFCPLCLITKKCDI